MAKVALGKVKGEPGGNAEYIGQYDSEDALKQAHSTGEDGWFAYVNKDLYIWNSDKSKWDNIGNMMGAKGDKGEKGDTGDPMEFGEVTVDVEETTGIPSASVTVTDAGEAHKKNVAFHFAGLKGETGSDAHVTYPIPIDRGGTGQTTVALARNAFGLGNTAGALPVANGGTGATNAQNARENLGIHLPLSVADGGTGVTDINELFDKRLKDDIWENLFEVENSSNIAPYLNLANTEIPLHKIADVRLLPENTRFYRAVNPWTYRDIMFVTKKWNVLKLDLYWEFYQPRGEWYFVDSVYWRFARVHQSDNVMIISYTPLQYPYPSYSSFGYTMTFGFKTKNLYSLPGIQDEMQKEEGYNINTIRQILLDSTIDSISPHVYSYGSSVGTGDYNSKPRWYYVNLGSGTSKNWDTNSNNSPSSDIVNTKVIVYGTNSLI